MPGFKWKFLHIVRASAWLLTLGLLVWGFLPIPTDNQEIVFLPAEQPASLQPLFNHAPARLKIDWPVFIRPGDPVEFRLLFDAGAERSGSPSGSFQAFGRFEAPGSELLSSAELLESVQAGETITLIWRIRPPVDQTDLALQCRIWFGVRVYPQDGSSVHEDLLAAPARSLAPPAGWAPSGQAARLVGLTLLAGLLVRSMTGFRRARNH